MVPPGRRHSVFKQAEAVATLSPGSPITTGLPGRTWEAQPILALQALWKGQYCYSCVGEGRLLRPRAFQLQKRGLTLRFRNPSLFSKCLYLSFLFVPWVGLQLSTEDLECVCSNRTKWLCKPPG